MRKWIINMGILTGIWLTLAGCGAPKAQVIMEAETAGADGTETQAGQELLGDPKERAEETVSFLEQFESSLSFQDMDRERAAAYGGPLEDSYAFYGRETEDGAEAMSWGSKYGRRAFWTGLRCMERTIIWRQ